MKLYEYKAKELMAARGIPVPAGRLAQSPGEAATRARELGPAMVKAQVLVGGRGKAGGIKAADTPQEARVVAERILGMDIKGCRVNKVYVEQRLAIDTELYLAVTVDAAAKKPLIITSSRGGVDIEGVPEKDILRCHVPVQWGFLPYQARDLARRLGLAADLARQYEAIAVKLYGLFRDYDAELAEINPLAVSGGRIIAADARLNIDDDALFRHPELPWVNDEMSLEARVRDLGLTYVQLDGDIAVMANGAGITMATLDVLQRYGGRPMNFLDAGGGATAEPMARALEILVSTKPRAILINIFGGITRCDDVALAIITARERVGLPAPLVVRLTGTNEERAVDMLHAHGIQASRSMEESARRAVSLAAGGGGAGV